MKTEKIIEYGLKFLWFMHFAEVKEKKAEINNLFGGNSKTCIYKKAYSTFLRALHADMLFNYSISIEKLALSLVLSFSLAVMVP